MNQQICNEIERRLPALNSEDTANASGPEGKLWALNFLLNLKIGLVNSIRSTEGIQFQKVDESVIRIVSILDFSEVWNLLAMMLKSFSGAGVEVQLTHAIIIEMDDDVDYSEDRHTYDDVDSPGMEGV